MSKAMGEVLLEANAVAKHFGVFAVWSSSFFLITGFPVPEESPRNQPDCVPGLNSLLSTRL